MHGLPAGALLLVEALEEPGACHGGHGKVVPVGHVLELGVLLVGEPGRDITVTTAITGPGRAGTRLDRRVRARRPTRPGPEAASPSVAPESQEKFRRWLREDEASRFVADIRTLADMAPVARAAQLRGLRWAKSVAISSKVTQRTPEWPLMCSMSRSWASSTCGRPDTSGWIVMVNTA